MQMGFWGFGDGSAGVVAVRHGRSDHGIGRAVLRSVFKNVAPPMPVAGAGHFIQEDAGEEVAHMISEAFNGGWFVRSNW